MLADMTASPDLDLLVLGGTSWLGGAVARHAVDRGHRVTCLARGESGEPPAGVSWVKADRSVPNAYEPVAGHAWDAVVEVSWQPDFVREALGVLAPTTDHWVYVSSCSVYTDELTAGQAEDAPAHQAWSGSGPVDWEVYGPAKVACEELTLSTFGAGRVLIARAGLIAGYGDRSDRLGYWPARVARAADDEPVLVPPRGAPAQVVDVDDLASWLVTTAERRTAGVFNAVGDVTTFGAVLDASARAAQRSPRFVEAGDEWLLAAGVEPWAGPESLPLWLPPAEYAGFMTRTNRAAVSAGLTLSPLADTVGAALRWELEQGLDRSRRAGLSLQRETELLRRMTAV
jgi:nucleoside-diphosphate-sugar epimerase